MNYIVNVAPVTMLYTLEFSMYCILMILTYRPSQVVEYFYTDITRTSDLL